MTPARIAELRVVEAARAVTEAREFLGYTATRSALKAALDAYDAARHGGK